MTHFEGGRPAEIFGYPIWNNSDDAKNARQACWCPFMERRCTRTTRLTGIPLGVCSVEFQGGFHPICKDRFAEAVESTTVARVLDDIGRHYFGDLVYALPLTDVALPRQDVIDCVLLRKKVFLPEVEDFTIVERQTSPVVRPGALAQGLRDFLEGVDVQNGSYGFDLNIDRWTQKAIARLFSIGLVCEAWNAKCYWILEERLFQALVTQYGFESDGYSPEHPVRFAVYELLPLHDRLVLKLVRFTSTSMDEIDRALRVSLVILSRGEFVESLNRQWVKTMKHELHVAIARKIREKQVTSS